MPCRAPRVSARNSRLITQGGYFWLPQLLRCTALLPDSFMSEPLSYSLVSESVT